MFQVSLVFSSSRYIPIEVISITVSGITVFEFNNHTSNGSITIECSAYHCSHINLVIGSIRLFHIHSKRAIFTGEYTVSFSFVWIVGLTSPINTQTSSFTVFLAYEEFLNVVKSEIFSIKRIDGTVSLGWLRWNWFSYILRAGLLT